MNGDGPAPRIDPDLASLAELHGVQTSYRDWRDRRHDAAPDALVAALSALGVDIEDPGGARPAVERELVSRWRRLAPPVATVVGRRDVTVELRVRDAAASGEVRCHLTHESGEQHRWTAALDDLARLDGAELAGDRYVALGLPVVDLPEGYHQLVVQKDGAAEEVCLLVAPAHAYGGAEAAREWGVFLPLYALRTARDWGLGDLTDLAEFAAWVRCQGASVVGTLPLLPVYLGDGDPVPFDPSPYSPVSRLFWNELYLDLGRAPEVDRCEEARALLSSDEVAASVAELRAGDVVDYQELARVKGRVVRALSRCFFDDPGRRREEFEDFVQSRPEVEAYALFRGAVARWGTDWSRWPRELGSLADVDEVEARHHAYAQFLAREQVGGLSSRLREQAMHPYLDLPVGTRADGFDVWRHPELFARRAAVGAPPDKVFTGGQDWRFPPLHPQTIREDGYAHVRAVLAHHMELADLLRVDHVMGLHRLFWIPDGVDARSGVYVRYPAEELYAVLMLESHRHGSRVVGENLGTVPTEVEEALRARAILRMYVVQYEVEPDEDAVLNPVPRDAVAAVNTHDMPPFAGFWGADDVDDGVDLGLLDAGQAQQERSRRARLRSRIAAMLAHQGLLAADGAVDAREVHAALLEWLGASPAPLVLANLEDLWEEARPQNTPGTQDERVNWRRRAARTLEDLPGAVDVTGPLGRLHDARRDA